MCHFAGLTSGIDCTTQSSGASSCVMSSVNDRTRRKSETSLSDNGLRATDFWAAAFDLTGAAATELKQFHLPARALPFLLQAFGRGLPLPPHLLRAVHRQSLH